MPPLYYKHQVPDFAPEARGLWAVTNGSLCPATSLNAANRLFETHSAGKGLQVCGAQLTSYVGHSIYHMSQGTESPRKFRAGPAGVGAARTRARNSPWRAEMV